MQLETQAYNNQMAEDQRQEIQDNSEAMHDTIKIQSIHNELANINSQISLIRTEINVVRAGQVISHVNSRHHHHGYDKSIMNSLESVDTEARQAYQKAKAVEIDSAGISNFFSNSAGKTSKDKQELQPQFTYN